MCYKKRHYYTNSRAPISAFVHTLTDEELQKYNFDINRFSATFNINIIKKEDSFMVEKLEAYKAELEAKKVELENHVIDVEAEVIAFREARIAEEKAKIDSEVAKVVSDIECIVRLIECERAKAVEEVVAEEVVAEPVVE